MNFFILFHERKLNISCSFNPKFSARIDEDINSFPLITLRRHLGIFYLFCRGVKWALILKELNWNKPKINLNIDQYSKNIIDFCDINSFWILFLIINFLNSLAEYKEIISPTKAIAFEKCFRDIHSNKIVIKKN